MTPSRQSWPHLLSPHLAMSSFASTLDLRVHACRSLSCTYQTDCLHVVPRQNACFPEHLCLHGKQMVWTHAPCLAWGIDREETLGMHLLAYDYLDSYVYQAWICLTQFFRPVLIQNLWTADWALFFMPQNDGLLCIGCEVGTCVATLIWMLWWRCVMLHTTFYHHFPCPRHLFCVSRRLQHIFVLDLYVPLRWDVDAYMCAWSVLGYRKMCYSVFDGSRLKIYLIGGV